MFTMTPSVAEELHEIYYKIRHELLRFALARTGDDAEAEDVVQEVWLKIETRQISRVHNSRSYLFQMANNIIIDQQREFSRRQARDQHWRNMKTGYAAPGSDVCDASLDIEASLIEGQEARQLHDAIAKLPSGARAVLYLHKIEGLTHGEVARCLDITRSGVEKHMAVAMRHLRKALID